MYIARKKLRLGDGYREAGDPVPEAASWKPGPLGYHLRLGWLEEVPDTPLVDDPTPNLLGITLVPGDPWGNVRRTEEETSEPDPEPKPKFNLADLMRLASTKQPEVGER